MAAAKSGHAEVVRALLEAGAEVDHADNEGLSAAIWRSHGRWWRRGRR